MHLIKNVVSHKKKKKRLRANGAMEKTILSTYYHEGKRFDVSADHVSLALKMAATALEYPILKGIPIARINTDSLRSGGANALALAGYSDMQIQKMGCWRGATFKEYIRNELACFSTGISRDIQKILDSLMLQAMRSVTLRTSASTRNTQLLSPWR